MLSFWSGSRGNGKACTVRLLASMKGLELTLKYFRMAEVWKGELKSWVMKNVTKGYGVKMKLCLKDSKSAAAGGEN